MIPSALALISLIAAGEPDCPAAALPVEAPFAGSPVSLHGDAGAVVLVGVNEDTAGVWRVTPTGEGGVDYQLVAELGDVPLDVAVDADGRAAVLKGGPGPAELVVFEPGASSASSARALGTFADATEVATVAPGLWAVVRTPPQGPREVVWVQQTGTPPPAETWPELDGGLAVQGFEAFFASTGTGGPDRAEVWRRALGPRAEALQVSREGGRRPSPSPDGRWVAWLGAPADSGLPAAGVAALHLPTGRVVDLAEAGAGVVAVAWPSGGKAGEEALVVLVEREGTRSLATLAIGPQLRRCGRPTPLADVAPVAVGSVDEGPAAESAPASQPGTPVAGGTPAGEGSQPVPPPEAAVEEAEKRYGLGLLPDWFGVQVGLAASTKNVGFGFRLRYAWVAQTNVSTDYLLSSFLNGLWVDDIDAFRVSASQLVGFRLAPWPFELKWLHEEKKEGRWPDIAMGLGAFAVLEVDHALQFFRTGDAGIFGGASVGPWLSFLFRDVTVTLQYRPFAITGYWIDGKIDSTPFNLQNPILDINVTYTFPL